MGLLEWPMTFLGTLNRRWNNVEAIIECFKAAVLYLGIISEPALAISDDLCGRAPACYRPSVIIVKPEETRCHIFVHEMVHHKQYELAGMAKSYDEWKYREFQAQVIEKQFIESSY